MNKEQKEILDHTIIKGINVMIKTKWICPECRGTKLEEVLSGCTQITPILGTQGEQLHYGEVEVEDGEFDCIRCVACGDILKCRGGATLPTHKLEEFLREENGENKLTVTYMPYLEPPAIKLYNSVAKAEAEYRRRITEMGYLNPGEIEDVIDHGSHTDSSGNSVYIAWVTEE